jgi:hypothetical protein
MLQLEVGKYYKNRKGDKVGPLISTGLPNYAFECDDKSWIKNGSEWESSDSDYDLIEEWNDEEIISIPHVMGAKMVKPESVEEVLAQRQNTHGDFTDNARVMQSLKDCVIAESGWQKLTLVQREALHMILHKVGRIVSGNPNEPDHWLDIAGYATLAKDRVNS